MTSSTTSARPREAPGCRVGCGASLVEDK
jgi:hypothetical protein